MTLRGRWVSIFIILVCVFLIFVWMVKKRTSQERCDYDGAKIQPLYAVYFHLQDGSEKRFCSVVCASMSFQELKGRIKEVMVVDEPSGNKINASQAFFVESEMVTVPHVKNRIHVLVNREYAERHIKKFKGRWIENPFQ